MKHVDQTLAHTRTKYGIALVLTFAAGYIDIAGFLSVYRLFTAHVTGTTVHTAEYLVHRNWRAAAAGVIILGTFLLGSIIGRLLIEMGARTGVRRIASIALSIEIALLASVFPAYIAIGSQALRIYVPLLLLGGAMGVQTAALTKIGPLTIHTTFVTGMLNRLAELVSSLIFRKRDLRHATNPQEKEFLHDKLAIELREARFILGIWFLYMTGAATGTAVIKYWHLKALYLACGLLLVAIAVDQASPLSIEEEKQQLQS